MLPTPSEVVVLVRDTTLPPPVWDGFQVKIPAQGRSIGLLLGFAAQVQLYQHGYLL